MWLFHPLGFASIVANEADKSQRTLLARSRFAKDLKHLFPGCKPIRTPQRDYLYRAVVARKDVRKRLGELAAGIDYTNFKDTIPLEDRVRHHAYHEVWQAMYDAQNRCEPLGKPRYLTDMWREFRT